MWSVCKYTTTAQWITRPLSAVDWLYNTNILSIITLSKYGFVEYSVYYIHVYIIYICNLEFDSQGVTSYRSLCLESFPSWYKKAGMLEPPHVWHTIVVLTIVWQNALQWFPQLWVRGSVQYYIYRYSLYIWYTKCRQDNSTVDNWLCTRNKSCLILTDWTNLTIFPSIAKVIPAAARKKKSSMPPVINPRIIHSGWFALVIVFRRDIN